jgi:hypothetical protein
MVVIMTALHVSEPGNAYTGCPSARALTEVSSSYSGSKRPLASAEEINTFQKLVDQWHHETMDISSLTEMVAHPAYLAIIGMGDVATPLLLNELAQRPSHWFVALAAINRVNPVPAADAGNFKKMTEAWLKWGQQAA